MKPNFKILPISPRGDILEENLRKTQLLRSIPKKAYFTNINYTLNLQYKLVGLSSPIQFETHFKFPFEWIVQL